METETQLRAEIENLRRGLEHRDVIGQAKGVLMERHRIDADEAFDRLRRMSQSANVKLHDVALKVIGTVSQDARSPRSDGDGPGAREGGVPRAAALLDRRHRQGGVRDHDGA